MPLSAGMAQADEQGSDQWMPVSDLMAALMMIFMLIAVLFAFLVVERQSVDQATCDHLRQKLQDEFGMEFQQWQVELLPDLTIRFHNPSLIFEAGESALRPAFKPILNSFFPRYVRLARQHAQSDTVREMRIEGHTSSEWAGAEGQAGAYFMNMKLSQDRTRSILRFVLELPMPIADTQWLRPLVTANGLSSSKTLPAGGVEDPAKSRRVEFRLITDACQQAGVYERTMNSAK